MKRIISILLMLSIFNINVLAGGKGNDSPSRFTYGLEWGYVATIVSGWHNYFIAPEGYRMETKGGRFGLTSNADMYMNVGYNMSEKWNISLFLGYEGIAEFHKAVPVSLRMTRYSDEKPNGDRWFSFIDAGSGIIIKREPQGLLTGKVGAGYSMSLSEYASLDFFLSARYVHAHSQIIYYNTYIPLSKTDRNMAYAVAISLGMALKF